MDQNRCIQWLNSQVPPWSKGLTARKTGDRKAQFWIVMIPQIYIDIHCSEWSILNYVDISISIHIPYPIVYSLHPWYLISAFRTAGFHYAIFGRSSPLPDQGDSASLVPWALPPGPRSRQSAKGGSWCHGVPFWALVLEGFSELVMKIWCVYPIH